MAKFDPLVFAIDQGTSSTKAIAVGGDGSILAKETVPIGQTHGRPGWVEQDAQELFQSVEQALQRLMRGFDRSPSTIGLSTQRESAVLWERKTGLPVGPMLGWQDRRTSHQARELTRAGFGPHAREVTGLPIDPMFSALKFAWLLDSVDPDRRRARAGELALGTVDSYLAYRLTGHHQIEAGNASRTLLMDIETATWSSDMLELFDIPAAVLPEIVSSNARTTLLPEFGLPGVAIDGVLGDSHAALYGHGARTPGDVKVTYGTGSSIMGLLAPDAEPNRSVVRTVAWKLDAMPTLAFEGNILATGATLVWLSDLLHCTPGQLIDIARSAPALHGVNLIPAFAGLGAPWWSETAEATIAGFTLGTRREVIARAAVDSIALQVEDVLEAVERGGTRIDTVLIDGGPSANDWLAQLQADLSQRTVRRSSVPELSALGVAELAAETAGVPLQRSGATLASMFQPMMAAETAAQRRTHWNGAVSRVISSFPARPVDADVRI